MDSHGTDNLGSVAIGVSMDSHGLVDRAVLAGNLLVDRLAHLPGHGGALLHLGGDGHADGDGPAVSDWLVDTGGLGGSPGDGGALGNSDTVRNSDTFWNSNTLGNLDGSGSLDRNLSALPVNLLVALGRNSNWSSDSNGS